MVLITITLFIFTFLHSLFCGYINLWVYISLLVFLFLLLEILSIENIKKVFFNLNHEIIKLLLIENIYLNFLTPRLGLQLLFSLSLKFLIFLNCLVFFVQSFGLELMNTLPFDGYSPVNLYFSGRLSLYILLNLLYMEIKEIQIVFF